MAPSALDKAKDDREALRDHLDLLQDELTAHAKSPLGQTQSEGYCTEAAEVKKQLLDNQKTFRLIGTSVADIDVITQDFKTLFAQSSRLHCGFHGIASSFPATSSPTAAAAAPSGSSVARHIKLPPLELPKFGGNLQEWVPFRDMYVTAIHNSSLSKVEKLTQLKSLLTGEAARQVRSLVLSEANYDIAWQSLKERYENNRELLFSILKRLFAQPIISHSTATGLRSLIDTTRECVRSLEVLSIPTQHWDAVLLYILFSKLDPASRELWEQSLPDTSIPNLSKIYEFLEQRARALAASATGSTHGRAPPPPHHHRQPSVKNHHSAAGTAPPCKLGCTEKHPLFRCTKFIDQRPQQRLDTIKRFNLCHNCLFEGHFSTNCKGKHNCKVCKKRHHSMLHFGDSASEGRVQSGSDIAPTDQAAVPSVNTHHVNQDGILRTGILATARVRVISSMGKHARRCLIDQGSTNTYITESSARNMQLKLIPVHIPMTGLSASSAGTAKFVTTFSITSHFDSALSIPITALVVKTISTSIPSDILQRSSWTHLQNLQLADPDFDKPGVVDLLLGTDVVWSTMENGKIEGPSGTPFAINTTLGWLVAGPNTASPPVSVFTLHADLDQHLCRFWEQEEINHEDTLGGEEQSCEEYFKNTTTCDSSGRFTVNLPFKSEHPKLGESRALALQRFIGLENKFVHHRNVRDAERIKKLEDQWQQYKTFMLEYEQLGHMTAVSPSERPTTEPCYYCRWLSW